MSEIIKENMWLLDIVAQIYELVLNKEKQNHIGCALLLYGTADTCKSTILRILGSLFQPYQLWVGSQWLGDDNLRWDTCTRLQAKTLITEEMVWQSLSKKQTLVDTITMIKEQLTGAGANNRLSKTGAKTTHTTSALRYFFFSMNNGDVTGDIIKSVIESKPEYTKRWIVINMDEHKDYIQSCLKQATNWNQEKEQELINALNFIDIKTLKNNKCLIN